jgi:hypothetical protein
VSRHDRGRRHPRPDQRGDAALRRDDAGGTIENPRIEKFAGAVRGCAAIFPRQLIKRTIDKRWRFTHLPMGERRDKATAAKLHRMGTSSGWPDFLFCGPGQVAVWLELKSKNGRLSETQVAMREFLQDSGFEYLCAHDVDQAIAWLKHHGILRGGFTAQ